MPEKNPERSDDEIVRSVLDGDVDAYEEIVDKYRERVFRLVMKHVPADDVESVAHDAFVRAYMSLPSYRKRGDFDHWLTRIALRAAYDYWRERYRSREAPIASLGEEEVRRLDLIAAERAGRGGYDEEAARDARDILGKAMERLSPEDRIVLELVHIEERPVKEAAALLGWSVANVKVRAYRSRKKLRSILEKMLETQGSKK